MCGAQIQRTTITYTQQIGETVSLVTDVPAEVCSQCGETYLSPETVDTLQTLLHTRKTSVKTLTVPVYHFSSAA